jgi:PAS domain S-box-containing protein
MKNIWRRPPPWAVLVVYTLALAVYAILVAAKGQNQGLISLFMLPVVIVAFFYPRWVYGGMCAILWGVILLGSFYLRDVARPLLLTGTFSTLMVLALAEVIHGLVSKVRRSEARARAAQERLEFILSSNPGVLYTRNLDDGSLTLISRNVEAVLGQPPEVFLDPARWLELVHPDDRAALAAHAQVVREEGKHVVEYRLRQADGSYRWPRAECRVLDDGEQGRQGVGLIVDITQRREAEAERERLIAELQEALANVKTLRGLLPICAWCKRVRDDAGYWQDVALYLSQYTDAQFTHGLCPDCLKKLEQELAESDPANHPAANGER